MNSLPSLSPTELPRLEGALHRFGVQYCTELEALTAGSAGMKETGIIAIAAGLLFVDSKKKRRNIFAVMAESRTGPGVVSGILDSSRCSTELGASEALGTFVDDAAVKLAAGFGFVPWAGWIVAAAESGLLFPESSGGSTEAGDGVT